MTEPNAIDRAITTLVQQAPALDAAIAELLVTELRQTRGEGQPLALAIARVVELVIEQLVDPGIALLALAMACSTLTNEHFGRSEFDSARYEIETLLPLPGPPGTRLVIPDVPLTQLRRRGDCS